MLLVLAATLALLALPFPGVPSLPPGSEIRVTSPDLRVVYLVIRVEKGGLVLERAGELVPGQEVAVVVRVGKEVRAFPGQVVGDEIVLLLPEGRASLRLSLEKVYGLSWPEEVPRGPGPGHRGRP